MYNIIPKSLYLEIEFNHSITRVKQLSLLKVLCSQKIQGKNIINIGLYSRNSYSIIIFQLELKGNI